MLKNIGFGGIFGVFDLNSYVSEISEDFILFGEFVFLSIFIYVKEIIENDLKALVKLGIIDGIF